MSGTVRLSSSFPLTGVVCGTDELFVTTTITPGSDIETQATMMTGMDSEALPLSPPSPFAETAMLKYVLVPVRKNRRPAIYKPESTGTVQIHILGLIDLSPSLKAVEVPWP